MAKPKRIVGLRWQTWQILRRMIRDYIAGRLTNKLTHEEPRRWPRGGGKDLTIRFSIVSLDPLTRTATCLVRATVPGQSIANLPGVFLGNVLYVEDPLGCYFNEPNAELTGREGFAKYMQPVLGQAGPAQDDNGYDPVPQWEVFALCCNPPECSD